MSMRTALMEMMNNQVNEAQRKTLKDSDKVYDVGKGVGQLDITHHIRKKLDISGKGMDTVYFDSSTLVYGDKTVVRRALVNKRLTVGDLVKEVEKFISKNGRNKPTYESVERASWVPEAILDDDVADFMGAAAAAKKAGKKEFEFGGKKYKVTMKDKTADAISEATCPECGADGECQCEQPVKEEMDPTDHVSKKGDMYCVYNKDGEEVAKFDNEEEANAYAIKNHDALMGKEEMDEVSYKTAMKSYQKAMGQSKDADDAGDKKTGDKKFDQAVKFGRYANKKFQSSRNKKKLVGTLSRQVPLGTLTKEETVEEAAAPGSTAQHGPDDATRDTYEKQMGAGENSVPMSKKEDIVGMHTAEVALDAEAIYKQNQEEAEKAVKQGAGRLGDQRKGDTSFVNPIKSEIIDGITKALQQMKTNS